MSITLLKNRLNQLQNEKKKLEKRQTSLKNLLKRIDRDVPDDLSRIKSAVAKTGEKVYDSGSGGQRRRNIAEECDNRAVTACNLDGLAERAEVTKENNRVNKRLQELSREIDTVRSQIAAEEAKEREQRLAALGNLFD